MPGFSDQSPLTPEQLLYAKGELHTIYNEVRLRVLSRLSSFSVRDQNIFRSYYGLDGAFETQTLEQVGQPHSLTRERVRQIVAKIWSQIRLKDQEADEIWLEGEMYRIQELADLLDPEVSEEILGLLNPESPPASRDKPKKSTKEPDTPVGPAEIVGAVSRVFRISVHLLLGASRKSNIDQARWVAAFLLKNDLQRSVSQIAADLHQNPQLVAQGCEYIAGQIKRNEWLSQQIKEVKKNYR